MLNKTNIKYEFEKKSNSKKYPKNNSSQPRHICQTRDPSPDTKITLQKTSNKNHETQFSIKLMLNDEIAKRNQLKKRPNEKQLKTTSG